MMSLTFQDGPCLVLKIANGEMGDIFDNWVFRSETLVGNMQLF